MGYGTQVASAVTVVCAAFLVPMLTCTVSLFYEVAQMHMSAMDGMDQFKLYANGAWEDMLPAARIPRDAVPANPKKEPCECTTNGPTNCPAGLPGPRGRPGRKGSDGPHGNQGRKGPDGMDVFREMIGPIECIPCPAGEPGPPGEDGPQGERGADGEPGSQGKPGEEGMPGDDGEAGFPGFPGLPGVDGDVGRPGNNGTRGVGIPGPAGPPGDEGEPGMPGVTGEVGEEGQEGEEGPEGPPGKAGDRAEEGPDGIPGDQGVPGFDSGYCPCPRRSYSKIVPQGGPIPLTDTFIPSPSFHSPPPPPQRIPPPPPPPPAPSPTPSPAPPTLLPTRPPVTTTTTTTTTTEAPREVAPVITSDSESPDSGDFVNSASAGEGYSRKLFLKKH